MKRVLAPVAVVVVLSALPAWAQPIQNVVLRNSFNPVGAGARGLGMGGAFIAVADDGTAASFNPAGLAQLRRSELAVVGFGDTLTSTLRSNRGSVVNTNRHGAPEFGGLSVPFDAGGRNLTIQISYQRAVDLFGKGRAALVQSFPIDPDDPRAGTFDFIGEISPEQSGAFHTAGLSAGYQVTTRLSLGASLNYWFGGWTTRGASSGRFEVNVPGEPRDTFVTNQLRFEQRQELRALNVNVGFLLRYPRISIGGVARLPFTGDYGLEERDSGSTFEFDEETGEVRATPINVNLRMSSRLHWPRSAGVGVALRPFKGMTLAGDYSRSHWSRTFIEDVPGGALLTPDDGSLTDRNFFDLFPASLTSTADTDQLRGGAEYLIVTSRLVIPLRAGVFRDRSPVGELGSDRGRRIDGYTGGIGLNFNRLVLDVAYEQRTSEGAVALRRIESERAAPPAPLTTETVKEERVVASLIYRFGGDDPLKRAIRFLFVGPKEKEDN